MTTITKTEILWQQWIQPSTAPSAAEPLTPTTGNIEYTGVADAASAAAPSIPATIPEVEMIAAYLLRKNAELYRRLAK